MLSTHVEVVRTDYVMTSTEISALHARGGGPSLGWGSGNENGCSPCTWRWSELDGRQSLTGAVLSTHVEVVRRPDVVIGVVIPCSPRTWRWSVPVRVPGDGDRVLSTHVEVVGPHAALDVEASGALHARGGGPAGDNPVITPAPCSPRTWRWSALDLEHVGVFCVLSTHVEVVRPLLPPRSEQSRALHARGGGPPAS